LGRESEGTPGEGRVKELLGKGEWRNSFFVRESGGTTGYYSFDLH
jgi:hypothetical protein